MTVYLVGAGPGDPELLTRRGAALLRAADVIIIDRLVNPQLLDEVRHDALVIDAGKHYEDGSSTSQSTINDLLIEHGATAATVVRLKGGDPFVFGRGGEELMALEAAGIEVEIVPGVSSAFSVPALAGVPVTHRGVSSSVTVLSGHDVTSDVPWEQYGSLPGTLVLLMAVTNRADIARRLISGGADPATPVAVIEWGSTSKERRLASTLAQLGSLDVVSPAVMVVGHVARQLRSPSPLPRL